jgi:hypothetical protein
MFIQNLTKDYINKYYMKNFEQLDIFAYTEETDILIVLIKNLLNSSQRRIYITDFSDGVDDLTHMKHMYSIFGDEYRESYVKYINNIIFIKE